MADAPPPDERPRASRAPLPAGRGGARRVVLLAVSLVVVGGIAVFAGCVNMIAAGTPAGLPPAAAPAPTTTPAPQTTTPAPTATPTPTPPPEPEPRSLRLGDEGPRVLEIQQRLSELGYWLGEVDGYYGQLTRQAVMAFQKAEGLTRDGVAGPVTRGRLPDASRPQPERTEGDLIEVDLERQLLLVVQDGQVRWAFNTSTGNGEAYSRPSGGTGIATTPRGGYEIERQINGYRRAELGVLYRPKYFNGGIAVHGSGSIPARPASHGCVRVTNAAMDLLWSSGVAEIGTDVVVY
ncbi:MAG TPA: L,D-transpeptidase family protein [Pseudonocardia sp.]|nr:L,D-transpeptidase family protein [Pseudonocardia sp.]